MSCTLDDISSRTIFNLDPSGRDCGTNSSGALALRMYLAYATFWDGMPKSTRSPMRMYVTDPPPPPSLTGAPRRRSLLVTNPVRPHRSIISRTDSGHFDPYSPILIIRVSDLLPDPMLRVISTTSVTSYPSGSGGTGRDAKTDGVPSGPQFGSDASHLSTPPQFQPTAPSISSFSRQFPSLLHFDSADPTARWTGTDAAFDGSGDERGRRRATVADAAVGMARDRRNALLPIPTIPSPPSSSTSSSSLDISADPLLDDTVDGTTRPRPLPMTVDDGRMVPNADATLIPPPLPVVAMATNTASGSHGNDIDGAFIVALPTRVKRGNGSA